MTLPDFTGDLTMPRRSVSVPACFAVIAAIATPMFAHADAFQPKGGATPDLATTVSVPAFPSAGTRLPVTLGISNTPTAQAQALVELQLSQQWAFAGDSCGGLFGGAAAGLVESQVVIEAGSTFACTLYFEIPETSSGSFSVQALATDPDDANGANDSATANGTVVRLRVNVTSDGADNAPGDGICRTAAGGLPICTLRAAIIEANALPGTQRIELPHAASPYLVTAQGAAENAFLRDLDIHDSLHLDGLPNAQGARPVVAAAFASTLDRVLEIDVPNGHVGIDDIAFAGLEAEISGRGGVIAHRNGDLTLTGVDISGGAASEHGGGLYLEANAWLRFSSVRENASREGAGISANLDANEYLGIFDSEVLDNIGSGTDPNGGGLYLSGGEARLERTLIAHNRSDDGGGFFAIGSTVSGDNSTLSHNIADSNGGAAYVAFSSVELLFTTIAHNAAAPGNDNDGLGGGVYLGPSATAVIGSSIIHANTAQVRLVGTPPLQLPVPYAAACFGQLQSLGYNAVQPLSQDSQCSMAAGTEDSFNGAVGLGPLADNGGYGWTHALAAGSPHIDAADPACAGSGGDALGFDQRRLLRPRDGDADGSARCDQGAFEFTPAATVTVVKQGAGDGTITSDPVGIHCGDTCSAEFAPGTEVTLLPSQGPGSVFVGWVSPCTGTGHCVVTAQPGDIEVIAAYDASGPDIFSDGFECDDNLGDTQAGTAKGGTLCRPDDD